MFIDFGRRFFSRSTHLGLTAFSWGKAVFSAALDHSKLWTFGVNVVLRLSSFLFVVPFTLRVNKRGLRTLRAGKRSRQFMVFVWNIVFGFRLAFLMCITFNENFKWFISGKFTKDASFFLVWLVFAIGSYSMHIVLLCQTDEMVFLCNSASRLSKRFSRESLGKIMFQVISENQNVIVLP